MTDELRTEDDRPVPDDASNEARSRRSRLPMVALGCALAAVAVSVIAAVVVLTRDSTPAAAQHTDVPAVVDRRVAATDVIKLRDQIEVVVDAGLPRGVRVKDAGLATALGLHDDDVITALSGRTVRGESDVIDVTFRAGALHATVVYVELERGTGRTLMRWQLDGDLLDARRDAQALVRANAAAAIGGGSGFAGLAPVGPYPPGTSVDTLLDTIVQVDATHTTMPRATVEALLDHAAALVTGARVVPSMKSGQLDGYKLFAIRPSSLFARLGFENGDNVVSLNGARLADVDDLLSLLNDAKRKASSFVFELVRRGQPVTLTMQITK